MIIIKEVELKFLGTGYEDKYQADVYIYDTNNCLIIEDRTYNGKLKVTLENNKAYKVIAIFNSKTIKQSIYINNCNYDYIFTFNSSINNRRIITFFLTDYNYNLPIERGNIIIWPRQ